ncbi:hypothetical protein NMG60_11014273 [Bertholletia excelsa]
MSELCVSGTVKKNKLLCTLLSYFLLLISFLRSHPLYLSYLIFFSPYLLKLLSFLSPLFITTSLLLLGFLTLAHEKSPLESPESKLGFLISTCRAVLQRLGPSENTENAEEKDFSQFEELEAYKIVFDTSSLHAGEAVGEISEPKPEEKGSISLDGDSILRSLKSKSFLPSAYPTDNGFWETPSSRSMDENSCLGSYGSMRKEKEWRRTLACKLYEERHNSKSKKKDEFKYVDEEEEEEDIDGRLCCLQALKLSTGKMNLGMKRPNLVKISKAFKGIGWLHNVSKLGKRKGRLLLA